MNANQELKALINASNSGKKMPVLKLIETSPATAAALSKLNSTNKKHPRYDSEGNRTIVTPNRSGLTDISNDIALKSTDNENTLQIFPELEQGLRILVSGIGAPKDLNNTDINFTLPTDLKVSPLSSKLLGVVKKKLSKDFNMKQMLPEMLHKCLGEDGSYPIIVIPESSVDDMINDKKTVSTESLIENFGDGKNNIKSFGWIGDSDFNKKASKKNISFESFVQNSTIRGQLMTDPRVMFSSKNNATITNVDSLIRVTDNYDILKFPEIIQKKREEEINKAIAQRSRGTIFNRSHALEGILSDINNPGRIYGSTELNDIQLTQLLYKNNPNLTNVTRKIKTSDETNRYNIGAPLLKILPAEAVIPITLASNRKEHVAYYVLLDALGSALSKDSASSVFDEFRNKQMGFKSGANLTSYLMQRTADAFNTTCDAVTYQQMQSVAVDIIETDFLSRLRNGIYGEDVALVENPIFYDIMLTRMFREQQTQVLFVPASLMTYFHYKLRKNGTGKTLLEDSMTLNTLRAVLMFANVNRSVINSIGKTEVEATLDEVDGTKGKTLEIMKHEVLKARQSQALPATVSPTDINQYLKTSQIYFNVNNVAGLPGSSMKFSETSSNYVKPDTDLMEDLDKKAILGLGVPPELVTSSEQIEFATNIVANNIRLSKLIMEIQDVINPQMCKLARTYCMNHGGTVQELEEIIKDNLGLLTDVKNPDPFIADYADKPELLVKLLAMEFLSNFEVAFPRPDTVSLKNQMEAVSVYEESIDKGIKWYLSEDILSEATSGQITSEQVGLVHNCVKAKIMRDWLRNNAILPELFDIVTTDDEGKTSVNVFEDASRHANNLTVAITNFLKKVIPVSQASQSDMEKISNGQELGAGPGASSDGGGSSMTSDVGGSVEENEEEPGSDEDLGGMPEMPDFSAF